MKKFFGLFTILALWTLLLTGCGFNVTENSSESVKEETETSVETSEPSESVSTYPVTLTDATGVEVTFEEEPTKIVSLIPSNTEILFALGAGEKVVAVSDYCNFPEEVNSLEKIGGMEFNVEKIISLTPDVVFAHESGLYSGEAGLQQLKDAGITVFVVKNASSFEQVYETINQLGLSLNQEQQANKIIDEMKTTLADISEKAGTINEADKKVVLMEVSAPPELYTAGKGTFMDDMLSIINATNAAGDLEGWPMITEEEAVLKNPDVIVTTYGYYVPDAKEQILAREAWKNVPAVANNEVFDINSDLVSRPGPRLIEGVEELAKAVYPTIFQ